MDFWIGRGVDGFNVGRVHLLAFDAAGKPDWTKIEERISELRSFVNLRANETGKQVALFTSVSKDYIDNNDRQHIKRRLVGENALHFVLNTELTEMEDACDANCTRNHVVNLHDFFLNNNDSWPVYEVGNPYVSRVASRFANNKAKVEVLQMLLFMLEGSVNVYYGDELGLVNANESDIKLNNSKKFVMRTPMQWNDGKHAGFSDKDMIPIPVNPDYADNNLKKALDTKFSSAKMFKKMAEWRYNDEAFLYGNMELSIPHDNVIGIKRNAYRTSSNYFGILNFGNVTYSSFNLTKELNFTIPSSAGKPTVGIMTSNLAKVGHHRNMEEVDITKVKLEPYSGIVIKYK